MSAAALALQQEKWYGQQSPKYLQTTWQEAFAAPRCASLWIRMYHMLEVGGIMEDVEAENAVPALKEFLAL